MGSYIFLAVLVLIFILSVFSVIHGIKNFKVGKALPLEHKKMRVGFSVLSVLQIASGGIILLCYLIFALLMLNGGK